MQKIDVLHLFASLKFESSHSEAMLARPLESLLVRGPLDVKGGR